MTKTMTFWTGLLAALFLVPCAVLAGPAVAAIHFDAPVPIGTEVATLSTPAVGVGEDGATSIAWSSYSGGEQTLMFNTVSGDGTPGAARTLAARTALGKMAVAPSGAATVVGVRSPHPADGGSEIVAARVSADGTVEPLLTLFDKSGWYAEEPEVAVDPVGDATVVWYSHQLGEVRIEAVQIGADGTVGPTLTLAESGTQPRVAVDPQGRATVVWNGSGIVGIEHLRIGADGVPGPAGAIPGSGENSLQPALAVDSDGRVTVVWRDGPEADGMVDTNRIAADGTVGTTQTLSSEPLGILVDPVVAVDAEGRAWVAWSKTEGDPEDFLWSIQAADVEPDGTAHAAVTLSGPEAERVQGIAAGPLGYGWVAWNTKVGNSRQVQFRRLPATGSSLGRTETLPSGNSKDYSPVPVIDPRGGIDLAWQEVGPSSQSIVFEHGEEVAPETSLDAATWQPEATFAFSSPDYLVEGFECELDGGGFGPCSSPVHFGPLAPGAHEFQVRALDEDGGVDSTPATSAFEIPAQSHELETSGNGDSVTSPTLENQASGSGGGSAPGPAPGPEPIPPGPVRPAPTPAKHAVAGAMGPMQVKAGHALLRISCPGPGFCEGEAILVAGGTGRGGRLGSAHFKLAPHKTTTLNFPLGAKARRLLSAGLRVARLEGSGISARQVKLQPARD
jgi:hypothetical protein